MDKEEFTQKLSGTNMSQDEVDLLFHILDLSRDGYLYTSDFRSMESLAGHQSSHQLQAGQENKSQENERNGKEWTKYITCIYAPWYFQILILFWST